MKTVKNSHFSAMTAGLIYAVVSFYSCKQHFSHKTEKRKLVEKSARYFRDFDY